MTPAMHAVQIFIRHLWNEDRALKKTMILDINKSSIHALQGVLPHMYISFDTSLMGLGLWGRLELALGEFSSSI